MPNESTRMRFSFSSRTPVRRWGPLAALLSALAGCGDSEAENLATAMLLPESVGDWVRQEAPVSYDRETIFDYINGAGEVYRSYAFRDVQVARYEKTDDGTVTVELFDMGSTEDAFGVFSFAREQEAEGIGSAYERKGSILCFWQDRFYLCVAAEQGTPDPEGVLEEVARGISQVLPAPADRPTLVTILPPEGLVPFSDRFFHTHQSLNYHYYLVRENVLNLTQETSAVLALYQPGPSYLLVIEYEDEGDAASAVYGFREQYLLGSSEAETVTTPDGKLVSSHQHDRFVVVVLDAASESAAEDLRQAAVENLRQLLR